MKDQKPGGLALIIAEGKPAKSKSEDSDGSLLTSLVSEAFDSKDPAKRAKALKTFVKAIMMDMEKSEEQDED